MLLAPSADDMKREQSDGFSLMWPFPASTSARPAVGRSASSSNYQYAQEAWASSGREDAADDDMTAASSGSVVVLPAPTAAAPKRKKPAKTSVFVCPEPHCGKTFPRSFALRRHARIHTGTKPYACDFEGCSQRFNTSGNLSRHKRIHSGERPYPCIFATCGKRFNTSTKLKRHMRIHFPDGQNLFRCVGGSCTWSCDNYKEFAQHQKLHHNVIVGAQLENAGRRAAAAAAAAVASSSTADAPTASTKDNDYFSVADTTTSRLEYHQQQQQQTSAAMPSYNPAGSFLYGSSSYVPPDKPKATRKLMGNFFPSDLGGLANLPVLNKDGVKKPLDVELTGPPSYDMVGGGAASSSSSSSSAVSRRVKPPSSAFPSNSFRSSAPSTSSALAYDSYSLAGDASAASSSYASRASLLSSSSSYSSHYAPHLRSEDDQVGPDADDAYGHSQQQQQQHMNGLHHHHGPLPSHLLLRPPPTGGEDAKYGNFQVPPPMNPAAPEFTGEELSVVLQLMNESYC